MTATDPSASASTSLPGAKLGVWTGAMVSPTGNRQALAVGLDDGLVTGSATGMTRRTTSGVPYCTTTLRLQERRPGGTFLFVERGQGRCAWIQGFAEARWTDDARLTWTTWTDGSQDRQTTELIRSWPATPPTPFDPTTVDPANPVRGVWYGAVRSASDPTDTWKVEVHIERETPGELAGREQYVEASPSGRGQIAYCFGKLVLKSKLPDAALVLSTQDVESVCGDEELVLRSLGPNRVQVEFYRPERTEGAKPDATGTLTRKK